MAGPKFVNTKCFICNHEVSYPAGYNSKTAKDHDNIEWIQTKRGLKQFFHTNCYWAMIKAQKLDSR